MQGLTVEFQRFGDLTGVIRLSDRYIRIVGNTRPAKEIRFPIGQEALERGMSTLDYHNFERSPGRSDEVRAVADRFLQDVAPLIQDFLGDDVWAEEDDRYQIDVVTRALELAQLPFEVLEEVDPRLVLTRRIRQPWPAPEVVRKNVPRVLFAWAEPRVREGSTRRMDVPHDRHRELLTELMEEWGGKRLVEVPNATPRKLADRLEESVREEKFFTHVHLLAHGVDWKPGPEERLQPIDLTAEPDPPILLALEHDDGNLNLCAPEELAELFSDVPRPETFALATCFSGRVEPIHSGATFAHALHGAGIPVVLASQFALTKEGSDELIDTFLRGVIKGDDPRDALRNCRDALRNKADKTYYDRVALVGYVHVEAGLDERLKQRQFDVALSRLKAASKEAEKRIAPAVESLSEAKGLAPEQRRVLEEIRQRFESVREKLAQVESQSELDKAQLEELRGLQGSSLKREAEAAWNLSRVLSPEHAQEWIEHSHEALQDAKTAYLRAAKVSRDHHWTWVQWLVLELVESGSLTEREEDWMTARAAARDATEFEVPAGASEKQRKQIQEMAMWGWGSLGELYLLAPLAGSSEGLADAKACLDQLVKKSRELGDDFPIKSTLDQLRRYGNWWGSDSAWKLPPEIVAHAKELYNHLEACEAA